jgi:hypothetical protein
VFLSKIDVADAFYRIWIRSVDVPKLGVLFSDKDGEEQMVGLPLVPPMGWNQSPPILTAATEIVADLANQHLLTKEEVPPRLLDEVAETASPDEHVA